MKLFTKTLFFALAIAVLASCGKDDDPVFSVVGTWTVQSGSTLNLMVNGKSMKEYLVSTGMSAADADATIATYLDGYDIEATGVIFEIKSDGTYTQKDDASDTEPTTGTWKQSTDGKTLTFTDSDPNGDGDLTERIVSLAASDMSLDFNIDSYTQSGFTAVYVLSAKLKKG